MRTPAQGAYGAQGEKLMADMQLLGPYDTYNAQGLPLYVWSYQFQGGRNFVWFSSKLISEGGSSVLADRVGSNRASGARFYPYGEEITSTANDRVKFGTYTRDGFTGLDFADQRYYAGSYGRFNSPDKSTGSARLGLPGTWNRYAYVGGDPANLNDPSGLDPYCGPDKIWDGEGCTDGRSSAPPPGCFVACEPPPPDPDPGPDPGPQTPVSTGSSTPPPTCDEQLTNTINNFLTGTPLAGEGLDFVQDSEWGGLNPLLLVAIAGAESQFGAKAPKNSNNAFGLTHRGPVVNGHPTYPINRYATWDDGVNQAVQTIDTQFTKGNITVALLYSGNVGAYCVNSPGMPCSVGAANVATFFSELGGGNPNDPLNLLWPCKD